MNKNKREASVQRTITMGNAIRRDGRERQVEIIDDEDDEIEEISKQRTSAVSDRASRLITRRQRRDAARDMQFSSDDPGEEDWDQLQEVILLSKLEAEKQEERRKMCGTLQDVMSLQVEIEPLSPVVLKDVSAETTQNNKNKEEDEIEVTASPDLFSSSHEDQEQLPSATDGGNIDSDKELPSSPPLPVTTRSPETDERDCDRSVTQSTDQRQENARKKPKLRRTRKEIRDIKEQNEDVVDFEPKATTVKINEEVQSRTSMNEDDVVHGEKRKLQELDDSNSDTDDEDIPMKRKRMSLKRKKVLVFEKGRDTEDGEIQTTKRIHDCADDPQPKSVSVVEEEATSNNRSTPKGDETSADTRQPRMSPSLLHARLSRKYAKARSRPRTVKEAMKANLYFAPRGFNISAYTTLIIRMFEKYKQRLDAAQCKARTRLPWGPPVVCGKSQGKTLDAQLPGKTSTGAVAKSSVFVWGTARIDRETQLDPDVSNRRRTLRSSTTDLPNQTAEASTPTSERSRRMPPSCEVDSESDDEGLMTSYLDKMMASSAGAGPSKKTQQSLKNNDSSEEGFVETCEQTTEAPEETSEPKQTLTSSRVGVKNNDRSPECRISADAFTQKDQALFGVGVVLDSGGSKSLWNEWDASSQQLQSEVQGMKESKTGRNESQDENSTNSAEACGEASNEMHSSQSDVIQPPKRRTSLRPLDDDSTDDESNLSQPVFSLNLPRQESLTASQESLENKTNSESKPRDKNKDILEKNVAVDSQSVLTQSESQGILGKSVLETMATDGDILYSSQALTDTQASSHKLVTETSGRGGTAGLASSVLRPTAWTGREVCPADEEFAIDLDSDESQNDRLKRSEAAEKAAAAAIKRQQGRRGNGNDDFCEASSSSSTINKSQQPENVECPLCYNCFSASEIEAHASDCQGLSSSTQASSSRIPTTGRSVTSSPSRPKPKLKNLKVVLERSPFVKDKLLERATQQIDLARRNLDFNSSGKPDRNVPSLASSSRSLNQGSRTRGGKEGAVLRSDSGSETTGYQLQNDVEGSSGHSWLDPRSPQAKKPPRTYGGNPSKPLGDDLLSLNTAKGSDTDELFTTTKHFKRLVTKRAPSRTDEIESNSDSSSEDALMTQYGAERISSRRKTQTKEAKTANTDNNEQALEKLGSSFRKRPLSLSKSQSKAKKARHRNSDSGSDEDSDDFTIVCHFCSKKIPKEIYDKHAEEELEQRKRGKTLAEPTREVIIVNEKDDQDRILDQKRVHRRRKAHEDTPTSQSSETEQRDTDQNEHEIDWDAVSNSPIKCFQFTGNSTSSVDFENQFAHLKESKDGGRRGNSRRSGSRGGRFNTRGEFSRFGSRGDYGEFSNRGQYRGSYKKVYGRGRGKNYGRKFRGYRKKK